MKQIIVKWIFETSQEQQIWQLDECTLHQSVGAWCRRCRRCGGKLCFKKGS